MFLKGKWGTVCDDQWGNNRYGESNAQVACGMLGLRGGVSIGNNVTNGKGKIWLDEVKCVGNETTLMDCNRNRVGRHNCRHSEDVGVSCVEPTASSLASALPGIRLVKNGTVI